MIQVLINWIYITVTAYTIGYAVHDMLTRALAPAGQAKQTDKRTVLMRILLGLAAVTAYAEYYSLIAGVGLVANIILMSITLLLLVPYGRQIGRDIYALYERIKTGPRGILMAVLYTVVTLIVCYGTSRGYMHIDTNLYHAQAIRWIEDYGVVPGLANLHSRLGYNSAEFALNAIYSMRWAFGQSLHTTAGYIVLLGSYMALDLTDIGVLSGKPVIRLTDFIRLGLIFYICNIYIEMVSPASDYYAQTLIFILLILWLDTRTDDIMSTRDYAIISILMVYTITIKLSIGLLVLITILPAVRLIRTHNGRGILWSLLSGLFIALPYFIRNVIISGWILYPSTALGIFNVDWRLDRTDTIYDANEIRLYGRGYTDMTHVEDPITSWAPHWFSTLNSLEKLWVLATALAIVTGIVYIIIKLIRSRTADTYNRGLIIAVFILGTVFWFTQAPLIRYGYAYIIIMPLLVFGMIYTDILQADIPEALWKVMTAVFLVGGLFFLILKGYNLAGDIVVNLDEDYYYCQQDYDDGDAYTYEVDGVTIYVATDAGQIGYNKFPSSPYEVEGLHLRGSNIRSGFTRGN